MEATPTLTTEGYQIILTLPSGNIWSSKSTAQITADLLTGLDYGFKAEVVEVKR